MRRLIPLLLALSLLCGCAADTPSQGRLTFTDSTGTAVTLEQAPQRVAVLFSSYAEIWTLAGGEVAITVGETVERGFAPDTAVLVDAGAGHSTIDLEALVAAEPDLVIGTADYAGQRDAVDFCRRAGIPAAAFRVETFSDYLAVLDIFCSLTGQPVRYDTYGTQVQAEVSQILAAAPSSGPSYLFIRAGTSERATKAKTASDNFVCAMLEELGAENIAGDELTGDLSLEVILERDPDYLFITTMGDEAAARDSMDSILASPGWRDLTCVREGNYTYLSRDLFHYKPNARWAAAYRILAEILYPETDFET